MKQYLLSIYQPDGAPPPGVLVKVMREINALIDDTKAAGTWVFNGGLYPPSTATVVRLHDGEVLITDGPFAEGKEHIGGVLIITAPDLDSALEWDRGAAVPGRDRGLTPGVPPRRSSMDSVRSTAGRRPSWSASSATQRG
jgi:hypothetical protein